ncbi:ABC transporter substrate-binding protein [Neobacillus jeddahensis]|uniref:ABC transporter substrate-binding protein n=1 Tax=Neobacillus jeddahensis TaxID=1461580 RepID=UPI0006950487|nr:ABC transporter substrate-binding protein [Neobacillus jeddahensis]
MRNKKFSIGIVLLVMVSMLLSGCFSGETSELAGNKTSQKSSDKKILRVSIVGEAEKLDPHWSATTPEVTVISSIYNGLVRFAPGTTDLEKIEPDLAESWDSNEDKTVWTFHVRKGVKWHKGYGELTAEDVKWSFDRVMDPKTGSPWQSEYSNVDSVKTDGDSTVIFTLKHPDNGFLMKVLNYHGGNIVCRKAIEEAGDDHMNIAIGTGPFMLKEYRTQEKVVLVKNPDYFRGEPKLDGIDYIMMDDPTAIEVAVENGELHLGNGQADKNWVEQKKQSNNFSIEVPKPKVFRAIYLNTSKKPFDDIRVRQAFAYALNASEYVKGYLGTTAASIPTSPLPSSYFGSTEVDLIGNNAKKAKKLLAEAGYPNGLTLPKQYMTTDKNHLDVAIWAQDKLRKVGIEMPIEQVDHATYQANIRKDLNNVVIYGYVRQPYLDFPLSQFFYGPATVGKDTAVTNFIHYDKVDELLETVRVTADPEQQKQLYKQIVEQINEDVVAIPIAEEGHPFMRRNEVDLGYKPVDGAFGSMFDGYPIYETTDIKQ